MKDVLLDTKTVACVNSIEKINSFFWWKGKIESGKEILLIAKTKMKLFPRVKDLVRKNHSYAVPEIIALPVIAGSEDYLSWIGESTVEK